MEKSISKRVLRAGLAGLLAVTGAAAGSGCASLGYPISKKETEYRRIDGNNLTSKEKQYLAEFDAYQRTNSGLSEHDKDWIKTEYPFINPEKLRIRDKVFIMQEANKGFEWIWLK